MITITDTFSESKVIEYLGATLIVPLWANFIATDADGTVCVFHDEPYWDEDCWINYESVNPAGSVATGILSIKPEDSKVKL
ncbi:hypothetical protein XbC2_360 [Xanthomonas phage XbC2]|nr:hypothetical protein XbC2_360 [Xanthomonas phage XbC2]